MNEQARFLAKIINDMNTAGVLFQMENGCDNVTRVMYEYAYIKFGLINLIHDIDPTIKIDCQKEDL